MHVPVVDIMITDVARADCRCPALPMQRAAFLRGSADLAIRLPTQRVHSDRPMHALPAFFYTCLDAALPHAP